MDTKKETMTKEELLSKTREEILSLLKEVERPGMDKVIWYLENSDYFRARCKSHHEFSGGLAVHSLGVYNEFKNLDTSFPDESIRIVCLLHDICKAHLQGYNHIGSDHHGLRSALLLDALGLKFNEGERHAICNHIHPVKTIPEKWSYSYTDLLQHYIHMCDRRDCGSFQHGFDSYTTRKSLDYQIDTLLYSTHRPGIEIVIDQLHDTIYDEQHKKKSKFFYVPASVSKHHNRQGGLALHSMEVCRFALKEYDKLVAEEAPLDFDRDSVILCSLLHDVCKMDEYKMEQGSPHHTHHWKEHGPHGLKSLRLLKRWHLKMSDAEQQAIAWHMGTHANDAKDEYGTTYEAVASRSPLVKLIHEADEASSENHSKK